ncbi:hypothetical protein CASFOL_001927 [Castilleja foliolosa]|uniref:TLC domain-containing protein n=1 Tax=Castilleja foliolosa TaxID=1961234 RepID=A0ABD3EDI4_9LAMI
MMESIWTDIGVPSASPFIVAIYFAFAFVAARFILDRFIFRRLSVKLVYMCECGFYIYSIAALLVWETRRKDFSVMMSHHVITVFLIAFSYTARFFRVGTVVFALHDGSDVFLEAAKVLKYSGNELGASVCFGLLGYTKAYILSILATTTCAKSWSCHSHILQLYYFFNTMLLTLLVFHIYRWILICAMITRQLKNRGQLSEDIRSDSEDDD